ncbi:aldo/keto reductase [Dactylosporangium sp. CS-033363]|uniref:aldo/keto reductase n=1 Tax=Dactylosporangium sp. CS-033363 TaxID=3239935 RepID=UPI003D8EF962
MQYTNLGRSGLKVSRLCLGTMNFGWQLGEDDSHAILDAGLAAGINFVDTADMYGARDYEGTAETYIGSWLAKTGRRDEVVLATKVYQPMGDGPNDRGLSARHIVAACEASLARLGTDRIDLYQMHHVDRGTPWEEIWQAMDRLVAQGKVLYVGSSNFAGWHLAGAQAAAMRRHSLGLVSEQLKYSLLTRAVELEVVPAAQALGIGLLPWSPLAQGLLSGAVRKHREGAAGRTTTHAAARVAEHFEQLQRYETFCDELGLHPAAVALAWLLGRPGVTAPIVGPRVPEQLAVPAQALEVTLDDDAVARLNELFPPVGNGGPGPEAWAW